MQPSPIGMQTITIAVVDLGNTRGAYLVGHWRMPQMPSRPQQRNVLDDAAQGMVNTMNNGTVVSSRDLEAYGGLVREFDYEGSKQGTSVCGRCRLTLSNGRLYQLLWIGLPGEKPSDDIQFFFDSFQIAGKSDTGPPASDVAKRPAAQTAPPSPPPSNPATDDPFQEVGTTDPQQPAGSETGANPPATKPATQPPGTKPPSDGRTLADVDEFQRKIIYRQIVMNEANIQRGRDRIAQYEQRGTFPEHALQRMRESQQRTEKMYRETITRSTRLTEDELAQIKREGDQKGWPK
jgi:hypothetical protein